ncbi:MAG: hypothetical protein KA010_02075 [Saprospiraceae bacterium]|nr:hypothetical protein [Saprospiraceae bacterium]
MEDIPSHLLHIKNLISPHKEKLGMAVDTLLNENVSSYPIFVMCHNDIGVGINLVNSNGWYLSISTLEEFVTKTIIDVEKIDQFKTSYKDPEFFLCICYLDAEEGSNYIFIPRGTQVTD